MDKPTDSSLPLFSSHIPAGFPSPAEDYLERQLDLNKHLIRHPVATFFVRVSGDSMIQAGIFPNDILIVDRSVDVAHNKIIVAIVNGEFTVKRYCRHGSNIYLAPENSSYPRIKIQEDTDFAVWGVVTYVIHSV